MNITDCILSFPGDYVNDCQNNNGHCKVINATLSKCDCPEGHKGIKCDELVQPLTYVYGISGTLYFICFFVSIFLAKQRYQETKGQEFDVAHVNSVTASKSSIPKWVLLGTRLATFIFAFGVHINNVKTNVETAYMYTWIFYTVWNFITVIIYFAFGTTLSFFAVVFPDMYSTSPFLKKLSPIFLMLLHVELPNTMLVDIVLWAILYPTCGKPCPNMENFTSYVEHIINFFLMSFDFWLSSNVFSRRNVQYLVLYAACYAIFSMSWTLARDSDGHRPIYFFLDASNPFQPLWVVGVMLIHLVFFYFIWAFSFYILKRRFPPDDHVEDETGQIVVSKGGNTDKQIVDM
jgi:hypothetical protein